MGLETTILVIRVVIPSANSPYDSANIAPIINSTKKVGTNCHGLILLENVHRFLWCNNCILMMIY